MYDPITISCDGCREAIHLRECPDDMDSKFFCSGRCEIQYHGLGWWIIIKVMQILGYTFAAAAVCCIVALIAGFSVHTLLVVIVIILLLR